MSSFTANPYSVDHPADRLFYGRQLELNELREGLCGPSRRAYAIIGGRRFGKTSILRQLQRLLSGSPAEPWGTPTIPVYLNLLGYDKGLDSPEGFFSIIQTLVHRQAISYWRKLSEDDHASPLAFRSQFPPYCVFGDWLIQKCGAHESNIAAPRVILLLDEVERILHKPWTNDLLGSLRMLVYEDDSYSRVFGLVTAGSSKFFQEIEDYGSPLWQVLNPVYLLALSEEESMRLIQEPTNGQVPESVAQQVSFFSGGHPYLIQYIMQNLWNRLPQVTVEEVDVLARDCRVAKTELFFSWQQAIGSVGAEVYQNLVTNRNTWVSEQQIREQVRKPNIMASLKTLCYHGFAVPRDGAWTHFRYAGELFRTWFIEDFRPNAPVSGNTEGDHGVMSVQTPDATAPMSAAKGHLRQQLSELQNRYEALSKRIAALDKDLGRTLDGETKVVLEERRQELAAGREQAAKEAAQIERRLRMSEES